MFRLFLTGLLTLSLLSPQWAQAGDRRPNSNALSVMTFNVEFLWDGLTPEEGRVQFAHRGKPKLSRAHMADIAKVIRAASPDVVNLVEVENLETLRRLNREFLVGLGYRAYLAKGRDTFTGQDVALLTRIDPEQERIEHQTRKGTSEQLQKSVSKNYTAKFVIGSRKIALIGLHLLARPSDPRRLAPRQAQADAIRGIALELAAAGYELVVLGDFNDYDGSPESLDVNSTKPISNVLRTIKSLSPHSTQDDLMNVNRYLPKAERYTAHWDRNRDGKVDANTEFSAIDHILLSPRLAAQISRVEIIHGHDPFLISDHFPLVVDINLSANEPAHD